MATNYVQDGKTIAITAGAAAIASGELVAVGDIVAVALVDIAAGTTGDGLAEGVFFCPKLSADVVAIGKKLYLNEDGTLQLTATDATYAGIAWSAAGAGASFVDVKLNG
ncbi:capsid cement protein [Pectobacterium carotovorum]|uniref:DUF2190 family protein n=1 Tax=Pectobacterium carotovorum subsp. carotovorum TaxID=555 RepID=A0AAI9KYA5_PECCC|nr:capsid cement protein [Pectobacterium carotovorum]GKX46094.1 hypothetical protein SOASR016_08460 [Pectobacterium carotovorum subsp. carotovorum]GLV68398.1 hypothetical protein Pcaca03_08420 [Pectobacterium carotovorum subsp. carotovorum]